jgi:hypothetical protein
VRLPSSSPTRRAALIASAIAVPITVLLAFVLTTGGSGSDSAASNSTTALPAVTVVPPPAPSDSIEAGCTSVFAKLPIQLGTLNPRRTDSNSGFVAAWGDPAIVIRCGVARPSAAELSAGPELQDVNGVLWFADLEKSQVVYTTMDRAVSVEVSVPSKQDQPLTLLAPAVLTLPATCTSTDAAGNSVPGLPTCAGS